MLFCGWFRLLSLCLLFYHPVPSYFLGHVSCMSQRDENGCVRMHDLIIFTITLSLTRPPWWWWWWDGTRHVNIEQMVHIFMQPLTFLRNSTFTASNSIFAAGVKKTLENLRRTQPDSSSSLFTKKVKGSETSGGKSGGACMVADYHPHNRRFYRRRHFYQHNNKLVCIWESNQQQQKHHVLRLLVSCLLQSNTLLVQLMMKLYNIHQFLYFFLRTRLPLFLTLFSVITFMAFLLAYLAYIKSHHPDFHCWSLSFYIASISFSLSESCIQVQHAHRHTHSFMAV